MTPERWRQVKSALGEAMALGDAARAAFLQRLGGEDPEILAEVESLLAAESAAGSGFLETPAPAALEDSLLAADDTESQRLIGQRVGPYRLLAEIGSGGMGRVYRAVRADDEYRQEVAIKLVRAGVDAGFVAQRLRTERQILAGLAHPNIARLLDGGRTAEGVPYLVMELIEGVAITRYCDERRLDVTARLELFLRVCSAVQYAHQRMVIHRDLKPSNILVTADGTPKLLDFGIAKILEPGAIAAPADATVSSLRVLTPQYASPEQVRGETVTAASDVYSLGIILYELLTGASPFLTGRTLREAAAAASDPQPKRPSTAVQSSADGSLERLRRRLRGDLDNITLMALRREPERRYGTVERLADDIRRHLERLPVTARKPTAAYRAAMFFTRHRLGVVTAILVAGALIGGMVTTLHEAHIAEAQRVLADRRFDDVRQLADTLIFGVHDSIRNLPGAEKARRLLIDTAVRYLDSLSQSAAGDVSLQRELAAAYLRLGDLQGRAREANTGDYAAARRSYGQAFTLLKASLEAAPADAVAQRDMIVACGKLSDLLWAQNDTAGALSYSRETVARSAHLAAQFPADRRARYFAAVSLLDHGYKLFEIRGEAASALEEMRRAVAALESLHSSDPADPLAARTLTLGYSRMGEALQARDDYAGAYSSYEKQSALVQSLVRAAPQNTDLAHLSGFAELDGAGALMGLGRLDEATQHAKTALGTFSSLAASDPKIAEYRQDVARALVSLARIADARGQPRATLALLQQAQGRMALAASAVTGDTNFELDQAQAQMLAGDEYTALASDDRSTGLARSAGEADWRQARQRYESALAGFRQLSRSWFEAATGAKEAVGKIRACDAALAATAARRR